MLKDKFATNPVLSTMKEDYQIIKNFGFNKFADDEDEDDEGMFDDNYRELGIFEGDPRKEKEEYRERLLDHFWR